MEGQQFRSRTLSINSVPNDKWRIDALYVLRLTGKDHERDQIAACVTKGLMPRPLLRRLPSARPEPACHQQVRGQNRGRRLRHREDYRTLQFFTSAEQSEPVVPIPARRRQKKASQKRRLSLAIFDPWPQIAVYSTIHQESSNQKPGADGNPASRDPSRFPNHNCQALPMPSALP